MSEQIASDRTEVGAPCSLHQESRRKPWQLPSIEDASIAQKTAKTPTGGEGFFSLSKGGS